MDKSTANPKVSVIVPVYRAERFVSKCIDSILNQTYPNWELILVDDGSPDNSGSICDEYAAKDSRIRVFHKDNGGVSSARNLGIEKATGDWLMFVDADDWLNVKTISSCRPFFDDSDIIRFSLSVVNEGRKEEVKLFELNDMTKEEYISRIVSIDTVLGVWGGFYRRDLVNKNTIRFDPSLVCGEDWVVLLKCVLKAHRIHYVNEPLYYYSRNNQLSTTFDFRFEVALSSLKAQIQIASLLNDYSLSDRYSKELADGRCKTVYSFIAHCLLEPSHVTRTQFEEYNTNVFICFKDILYSRVGVKMKLLLFAYLSSAFRHMLSTRLPQDN